MRSARRAIVAAAAGAALVVGTILVAAPATAAAPPPLPTKIAALGDSITQASMTCTLLVSCPANSWSTGTTSSVASHATRLKSLGAKLTAYNDSVAGSLSAALPAQATKAASQGAQYVTVLIGANDACADTVAGMTSTAAFRTNVQKALSTLAAGSAKPQIFVASIPSIMRLWELNKGNLVARLAWAVFGHCDSMLAKPTSTAAADVQRRAAVQQRVDDYNAILKDVCTNTAKCRWDGGAVAAYKFSKSDISTTDYFHPSTTGQKTLAAITWATTQYAKP